MFIYLYRKYRQRQYQAQTQSVDESKATTKSKPKPCIHRNVAEAASSQQKCSACATDKSAARKYRWKLLLLLLPAFFAAQLDLTIVATALPFVASHFDKLNELNWIVTAFTLTSTAFIIPFGQLSDVFGRHATLQVALVLLTIGSVLCAVAPIWSVLLLGRGLQGAGSAGVTNIAMIILADSVSLKEQAINTSIFQFLNGIGYSIGPVIGGYIVDSSWRYAFVLCAGMPALSIVSVFFLRKDLKPGTVSLANPKNRQTRVQTLGSGIVTLDFGGMLLFLFGVGLIILGTAWGGSTYRWSSAPVLTSIVIGGILLITFVLYERLLEPNRFLSHHLPRTNALIPFTLLKNKDIGLICFLAAATGAAFYSVFYFVGIYFTLVEGYEASDAGVQLLYYIPGLGIGAYSAMFMCNVSPRQTFLPLFSGTIVETAGIAALTYAVHSRQSTLVNVMMAIAGWGTGVRLMPVNLHLAGMFYERLAPVYSLVRFAMPFGGTLALTIMGSVFQNKMAVYFGSSEVTGSLGKGFSLHNSAALGAIDQLSPEQKEQVRKTAADATMWAFVSIVPFLALALVASLFLGNVWISKKQNVSGDRLEEGNEEKQIAREQEEVSGSGGEVLDGVYLKALFTGTAKSRKRVVPVPEVGAKGDQFEGLGRNKETDVEGRVAMK